MRDEVVSKLAVGVVQRVVVPVQRVGSGQFFELGDSPQQVVRRHVERVRKQAQIVERRFARAGLEMGDR